MLSVLLSFHIPSADYFYVLGGPYVVFEGVCLFTTGYLDVPKYLAFLPRSSLCYPKIPDPNTRGSPEECTGARIQGRSNVLGNDRTVTSPVQSLITHFTFCSSASFLP